MTTRAEYPRPDFDRSQSWLCLNGTWDFHADPDNLGLLAHWEQTGQPSERQRSTRILVPFPWETPMSGVEQEWLPIGWYRRSIERPATWQQQRTILHFGAVHYSCQIWVSGQEIGEHTGGYTPFSFDITDALDNGIGELVVRVEAPLDKRGIPHGKQRSRPVDDYNDCAFTACSGIWQSVWLEERPATFIEHVQLLPTEHLDGIIAYVTLQGPHMDKATLTIQTEGSDEQVISIADTTTLTVILPVTHPQPWTPHNPHLYSVRLTLKSLDGMDEVKSYTGLRKIEVRENHIFLNGEQLYLRGALDQGYWPESGYTAPSDDALRLDVELAIRAGYNLIRKHLKLEDPRWLYWADRLGLLVWEEPPCVGRYSREAIATFEAQLPLMVARDASHPSIVIWGIYNEEWGLDWRSMEDAEKQQAIIRAYDLLATLDHSRPIIDDSGWSHVKTDILDWHYYDADNQRWRNITTQLANDPKTWFGHQLAVDKWYETQLSLPGYDHPNAPLINGEYGAGSTDEERGWYLRWQTQELRRHTAISGYIYTELYDVEHENAGIYDAQRHLKKLTCDPAHSNAETVFVFDFLPLEPGVDFLANRQTLEVPLFISYQAPKRLRGKVLWWCHDEYDTATSFSVELEPHTLSSRFTLYAHVPQDRPRTRLHVQLVDERNQPCAYEFLDVVRAQEVSSQELVDEKRTQKRRITFSEQNIEQVIGEVDSTT